MKILSLLKQLFLYLKNIFKMNVFNFLDAIQEQFGQWYYFEIIIKSKDGKDEYIIPILTCMREKIHAESLMNQIQKDLMISLPEFIHTITEIILFTKSQKDAKLKELETKFSSHKGQELKMFIYKVVGERNRRFISQFEDESNNLNVGNFEAGNNYDFDQKVNLRLNIIKNQGVPFHQISDCFIVKLDKSKLE